MAAVNQDSRGRLVRGEARWPAPSQVNCDLFIGRTATCCLRRVCQCLASTWSDGAAKLTDERPLFSAFVSSATPAPKHHGAPPWPHLKPLTSGLEHASWLSTGLHAALEPAAGSRQPAASSNCNSRESRWHWARRQQVAQAQGALISPIALAARLIDSTFRQIPAASLGVRAA